MYVPVYQSGIALSRCPVVPRASWWSSCLRAVHPRYCAHRYHRTLLLHFNHILFLHSYVLGVLMTAAAALRFPLVVSLSVVFACYVIGLLRKLPLLAGSYCLMWLGPIAYAAVCAESHLELVTSRGTAAGIGLAVVLGSFMLQLLGHCLHERYQAPISFLHGFVSAPPLEWVSLFLRVGALGGPKDAFLGGVWQEVDDFRSGRAP